MAEPESQRRNESAEGGKLYTLSEISQKTGISMPTLQRYKKMYQDRIPAVGQGRKQRYPENSLPVFNEIKTENAGRRGRPRKDASASRPAASKRRGRPGRPAKAAQATVGRKTTAQRGAATTGRRRGRPPGSKNARGARAAGGRAQKSGTGNLLTLTEISKQTGISYPTLVRYVRLHSDRLPHEGRGRARRFYPQAVDVFRQLRSESGRGGRKKGSVAGRRPGRPPGSGRGRAAAAAAEVSGGLAQRLKTIEKAQQSLEKKLRGLVKNLTDLFR